MTTATKEAPTRGSLADELAKLTGRRDKAYASVQDLKAKRAEYDAETAAMRGEYTALSHERRQDWRDEAANPAPGTPLAKAEAKFRERRDGGNPHQVALDSAVAKFHAADDELERFRVEQMGALIEERRPEIEEIRAEFRALHERQIGLAHRYGAELEYVQGLVRQCSIVDGQDVAYDPRPEEWRAAAVAALDGDELLAPSLREYGVWKLENR